MTSAETVAGKSGRTVFVVTSYPGQSGVEELQRRIAAGSQPRRPYLELARITGGDVIDSDYMATRASPIARAVARRLGLPAGQVTEAFLRRRRYATVCAFADRLGIPLALLFKLTRARARLVMVSMWLSRPKKAIPMRYLRASTRFDAIVTWSSVQGRFAVRRLGVPSERVDVVPSPVDEHFWSPRAVPLENMICAVGMEARDYSTLLEAVEGLEVEVRIAVGTLVFWAGRGADPSESGGAPFGLLKRTFGYRFYREWANLLGSEKLPSNVRIDQQLTPEKLRDLYGRARFVVVPLHDVDADCGITTVKEAMAMGKAVVVTRTKGQVDMLEDGKQGVYVPPYDAAALRSSIERLLASAQEVDRMGQAGRALVEARHTMDAHVRHFLTLLGEDERAGVGSPLPERRPS